MNPNSYSNYYESNYFNIPFNNDQYYLNSSLTELNCYSADNINYYQYHQQYYHHQYNNNPQYYLPTKENVMISTKIGIGQIRFNKA
jgi:hypothetical protein